MTSYRVVAPVFLARFQENNGILFRAWSPRRYGPAYTYDIIIECEDNQHPSMNMEYMDTLQRVMDNVHLSSQPFVDMTTDYHCPVPVEERGETLFVVTLKNSPFSPVFFDYDDAQLYYRYLYSVFVEQRSDLHVQQVEHALI
jgi:hypothetical protein